MAESPSPAEVDYLGLCGNTVCSLEDVLASGAHLLNPRQCKDLSSKLSKATGSVRELVLYCETSITPFRPGLENLHRCLEKAEVLVRSCAEEDWCGAAVLQIEKESAFRNILEDLNSCYKAIYEVVKSVVQDWNGGPEDLQQSSVFESARDGDVQEDLLELEKRLNDSAQVELLNLCRKIVLSVRNVVENDNVKLNRRQCVDLSSKLCITALNVFQLVSCGGASVQFHLALKNLYQVLERAKAVVSSCADDDWLAAAVFQIDNENSFRMILLDVSMCYNALYEIAKSTSKLWNNPPEDLRHPSLSVFMPAQSSDVDEDNGDLQKMLDDLANGYTKSKAMDYLVPGRILRTQSLARYLLVKMCSTPLVPQVASLDIYSALLWRKVSEPMRTWGSSSLLGCGSGASGVVSTTWLGIPCAKKEFHGQHNEGFFLKEAGILAHLKHPCVVNFVCCGNGLEKGDRFIAMELMEKSLADLIEEQNGAHFPLHVVVDMMVQIARGVCYLHGRGVAHRDLKPQNVVVNKLSSLDGESHYCVKLVDFGMSKTKVEASKVNTMSAFGIGTTRYRAPELGRQAHTHGSRKAGWFKADVYSFAMTCAHLLTLKTPFGEVGALYELDTKLMNGARPSLPGDCPKEIVALLKDCWNTRVESRPSFGEVCTRLEKFKYALLRGFVGGRESDESHVVGYDFIKRKVEEQSLREVLLVDTIGDDNKGKFDDGELRIVTCPIGHTLQFVLELPSNHSGSYCDICLGSIVGEHYECRACNFDIHLHCSKLELEVNVFLHRHPLHLLVQNYYNGKPVAICCICEEQVQFSEWVYRCEMCDIDMHALCTKLPEEKMQRRVHEHFQILSQCPPHKTLSCACCNGEVRANSWMYTCRKKCIYYAHPSCTLTLRVAPCVFDKAHELSLIENKKGFYCHSCHGFGFSWYYHCKQCDVNIHLDCKDDMVEEDMCHEVYEELSAQYMTKDNLIRVDEIVQLLDQLLVSDNLGGSLWLTSMPTPVPEGSMRMVQPSIQRLTTIERPDVDAIDFDDAGRLKKIAVETVKRKAKRMAAKVGSLESKEKDLEMLDNLERMVINVRNSKSVLQGDGAMLDARLERLKIRKHNVEDDMARLVQSKMRHGPHTCLFFQRYEHGDIVVRRLLTSLRADMEDVRMMFFCEEPGCQHYVNGSFHRVFNGELGEERVQKVQALLGRGLEVVARAVSTSRGQQLDHVILPVLGSRLTWDLGAIDVEMHGKPWIEEENVIVLKKAHDSAAEWVLNNLESNGVNIFKSRGLLRVRYKETEQGDYPRYTRGLVAWLCKEHVHKGLKVGILELCPLKYYNSELN